MPLIGTLVNKLKSPFVTEKEEFINHIKAWIPISIVIGIIVGSAMALFFMFILFIDSLLNFLPQIAAMTVGSTVILFLIKIKFENTDKNGINYVIKTKHQQKTVPMNETREFLSSGIALGSGLPIGKEGPALVIGSALACKIASVFRVKRDDLHNAITIGSAAATGALFQAPLGAAVFASEVPYKADSDEPMIMVSFLASVIAAVTLKTITDFMQIDIHLFNIGEAFLVIDFKTTFLAFLLGIVIGFMGQFFIDFYYYYKEKLSKFDETNAVMYSLILALIIIFIGNIIEPDLYIVRGLSSFDGIILFIKQASVNILWLILFAIMLQVLVTSIIIASGFPGGIFGPSLSIGALMGIIFAILLQIDDPRIITSYAIIGMSASHAATTKTPIASVLLILEITGLPPLIIPIVMANIAAYISSGHRSLYENQLHSKEAQILRQLSKYDQMDDFRVIDVMTNYEYLEYTSPECTISEMKEVIANTRKHTFPVIKDRKILGIISVADINDAEEKGIEFVRDVMETDVICLKNNMTAKEAMHQIVENDVERCPVIDDNSDIVGIVTIKDLLRGHQRIRQMNEKYFN